MRTSSRRSVADSLSAIRVDVRPEHALRDGDRVAVIGGGPAGSFFAYFLLKLAESIDLEIDVHIYEPRAFSRCGPAGCNHCGGIVSESLVQILAAEGINLPPEVVQRGIESYVVHMDAGSVRIASPAGEQRIAALYRGNGPRHGGEMPWDSFDDYLQGMAIERGARVVRKLVSGVEWRAGLPHLRDANGGAEAFDLVAVASGVNSNFLGLVEDLPERAAPPRTTRTYICEFRSTREEIQRVLGNAMHVFLVAIPRLEFAALIPKGEFVTLCMLGEHIDQELIHRFLRSPEVRACFPVEATPSVCTCSPLINVRGSRQPYADRLVMIGDAGVTRLYKDGIGAAFRTAKAAAATAAFHGVSADDFRRHYLPACRRISRDNAIGKFLFAFTGVFKISAASRRAVYRMTLREQANDGRGRHMSEVLWNMFTGSAPYREILLRSMHPAFLGGLAWNLGATMWPRRNGRTA